MQTILCVMNAKTLVGTVITAQIRGTSVAIVRMDLFHLHVHQVSSTCIVFLFVPVNNFRKTIAALVNSNLDLYKHL